MGSDDYSMLDSALSNTNQVLKKSQQTLDEMYRAVDSYNSIIAQTAAIVLESKSLLHVLDQEEFQSASPIVNVQKQNFERMSDGPGDLSIYSDAFRLTFKALPSNYKQII